MFFDFENLNNNIMKKITLISVLLCICIIAKGQSHYTQLHDLGLVAEMAYKKYVSEYLITNILMDTNLVSDDIFLKKYVDIKIQTDQIILQLVADLKSKNRIKYYKKLDKYYKAKNIHLNKILKRYRDVFNEIDAAFSEKILDFIQTSVGANLEFEKSSLITLESMIGMVEVGNDIIENYNTNQKNKVDGVCELLIKLRFKPINDIKTELNSNKKKENQKK